MRDKETPDQHIKKELLHGKDLFQHKEYEYKGQTYYPDMFRPGKRIEPLF